MKLSAMFNNGIPDCYYEGNQGNLWAEYKYIEKLPARPTTKIDLHLSPMQLKWIGRCNRNNHTCMVILGHKSDGWIIHNVVDGPRELTAANLGRADWDLGLTNKLTVKQIAEKIYNEAMGVASTEECLVLYWG